MNENNDNRMGNGLTPSAEGAIDSNNGMSDDLKVSRPINFLFDIPLELTVEVGRRVMTMGELVEVMPGTVVELDRPAGEKLDIFANGKLVARGEAVVVGERYGIRVMEVVGDDPFKVGGEPEQLGDV